MICADHREHGESGPLALGRRAGRARPDDAGPDVHRPDGPGVQPLEGGRRLEHLAHDETGDRARLRAHDNAFDHSATTRASRSRAASGVRAHSLGLAERGGENFGMVATT